MAVLKPIHENYYRGPVSRDRVYEALNALALAVATVVQGAQPEEAHDFFMRAYSMQSSDISQTLSGEQNDN
jgi:hypothetical protein